MVKTLDPTAKQEVTYAVPLWLRDEQIRHACTLSVGRIQPHYELRNAPIAVVGFGPSLADEWEKIKDFTHVITCSGSHRFLIDRGIVPSHHVEVDPRKHKIKLLGEPHPMVEYLIASTCHPDLFAHLKDASVLLWHVFDSKEEGIRTLPRGEWALTGGSDVGLRAMTIARFLGFTDLHLFGFDGCEKERGKHADAHPNEPKGYALTEYQGVEYRTTQAMLHCAQQMWHELNQMPDVKATFYGDGLIQHMAKFYVPAPVAPENVQLGFAKPELISVEYARLNAQLHQDDLSYGVGGAKHAPVVIKLVESIGAKSVLDYGCGKGYLAKSLPFPIWSYDPAVEGLQESPRPADLVTCTDVLEHIEPEKLTVVLDDLRRCVKQVGYFVIHTGPARKKLADGRNTHLIQRGRKWWEKELRHYFSIGKVFQKGPELHVVVGRRQ